MNRSDRMTAFRARIFFACVFWTLALTLHVGCNWLMTDPPQPEPPKPPPKEPSNEGNTPPHPPEDPPELVEPVIVITASGPQLNGKPLTLDHIVVKVRDYVRDNAHDGERSFTVTIEPDVRVKDENEAREKLAALQEGPHRCKILFATPPAPGGRFPSRGD